MSRSVDELPTVFAVPLQLSMIRVKLPGVNESKVRTPTVPVPKSIFEPDAVSVSAPSGSADVLTELGVGPGECVALFTASSLAAIIQSNRS